MALWVKRTGAWTGSRIVHLPKPMALLICVWISAMVASPLAALQSEIETSIERILSEHCLHCHSGDAPAAELDLTIPDRVVRRADADASLLESEFWSRIESGEMPPQEELPDAEQETIHEWLSVGAPWNRGQIDPLALSTTRRAGRDWWAFQPIATPEVPKIESEPAAGNPIDSFVVEKLQSHKLSLSAPAPPHVQIRRLYFDLVGLPPPIAIVRRFVEDPTEEAYVRIVDELLSSPEYGERWARHWLDLVRFGESDGFERNAPRPDMWPYRDWVIKALNDDIPYDEFARQQLAAAAIDQLDPVEAAAAQGFLVAGVHNTVVGSSRSMQLLARQDEMEDLIGNVGQTFLGLTFNCARCHDHKFDPITQKEYYRLVATFAGVKHGVQRVTSQSVLRQWEEHRHQLSQLLSELRDREEKPRQVILSRRARQPRNAEPLVTPVLSWSFDFDEHEGIQQLPYRLIGGARVADGSLILDGVGDYLQSDPLPFELQAKSLEVLVEMEDDQQRGGGVLTVETLQGDVFDSVVYGEREPGQWMAGSNFFSRTQSFHGPVEESSDNAPIHLMITYTADGQVSCYRNGIPYGQPYVAGQIPSFAAGESRVLIGLRHSPPSGGKFFAGRVLRAQVYDRALSDVEVRASAESSGAVVSRDEIVSELPTEERLEYTRLCERVDEMRMALNQLKSAADRSIYTSLSAGVETVHFLPRGDVMTPGPEMSPGTTRAIPHLDSENGLRGAESDIDRRRGFADWVTDPANPLFSRVIVNRLWHYHFGAGFVKTPSDFGFNGGRPSHPELLDWLCGELARNGYRLKPIHRLVVTSRAYRQDSRLNPQAHAMDGDNRWLWRRSPTRLDGEIIRDSMLAVTGRLNAARGGPGFRDVTITDNGNGTTYYTPFDAEDPELNRRTVYRFSPRGGRSALLDSLDCPDPSTATPARSVTTTPLQALSLLNNAFVLRMCDALDQAARRERETLDGQIAWMFETVYSRPVNTEELDAARTLAQQYGLTAVARALFNSNEFITLR